MGIIRILPPQTARRIAAGEVIDRPASALRELIDNSIDAQADDISVSILKGGIEEITVTDNGLGMSEDDLVLCVKEHATSKIYDADDLLRTTTLGFRGEALASIASVARLEIATRPRGSAQGWRLQSAPFQTPLIDPFPCREGTRVTIRGLFDSFPARRQFLKRPQSEAMLCRSIFIERTLAHPALTFRWQSSGESETFLPSTYARRIAQCYPELSRLPLHTIESSSEALRAVVVHADISCSWRDRKFLQVFINRRRVPEWSIVSLVDYAFGSYLPGGAHPCAFVFLEIDPSQADFNIHPAKKEVRLRNAPQVRDALYRLLSEALKKRYSKDFEAVSGAPGLNMSGLGGPDLGPLLIRSQEPLGQRPVQTAFLHTEEWHEAWHPIAAEQPASQTAIPTQAFPDTSLSFRYIGHGPGPFILFELKDSLWIMDQHAAHERILYDRLKAAKGSPQPLLVPHLIDPPEHGSISPDALKALAFIGYEIQHEGSQWVITAVPAIEPAHSLEALEEWLSDPLPDSSPLDAIAARLSCRAAIKDGETLQTTDAERLIAEALALPEPRCPHGRPIFISLSRERLYELFGRIVF